MKQVSCGGSNTFFLTSDGELLGCGIGEYGRLGTGSTSDATVPTPLDALVNETITQVSAGHSHALALTAEGKFFSWGRNDMGQLGHADSYMDIYSMEGLPRVVESAALTGRTVCKVSAGNGRSLCVTTDGDLFVWGKGLSHVPTLIDRALFGGMRVVQAFCAGDVSYACTAVLTEDGALWTMGNAKSRLLGFKGASGRQLTPHKIEMPWGKNIVRYVGVGMSRHMAAIVEI